MCKTCKDCNKRGPYCHTYCEVYKAYKVEMEKIAKNREQSKMWTTAEKAKRTNNMWKTHKYRFSVNK